jgi:hypothetical protein
VAIVSIDVAIGKLRLVLFQNSDRESVDDPNKITSGAFDQIQVFVQMLGGYFYQKFYFYF